MEDGIKDVILLNERESQLLRTKAPYEDEVNKKSYKPGETFMINGPCEYIPPVEVEVCEKRTLFSLTDNEGIYVQCRDTGKVTLIQGPTTYKLKPTERLWEKVLEDEAESLLREKGSRVEELWKAVTFKANHNSAV